MNHKQIENRSGGYLWWSRLVAIALAVILLLMWLLGHGPFSGNCCQSDASSAKIPANTASTVVASVASEPLMVASSPATDVCATSVSKADVSFNTGSIHLSKAGQDALDGMVACVEKKGASIVGHTDNVGSPASNLKLSERRAQAVALYLEAKGVPADKLSAKGMGDAEPIADNRTIEGRAKNRRMVIQLNP